MAVNVKIDHNFAGQRRFKRILKELQSVIIRCKTIVAKNITRFVGRVLRLSNGAFQNGYLC